MKQKFFILLLALLTSTNVLLAWSYPEPIDGWWYSLDADTHSAMFMGCWGGCGDGDLYVTIPSMVVYDSVSYVVTEIYKKAFYQSTYLKALSMPNTIKSIGEYAFAGCTNLSSINLSNNLETIGRSAFGGCTSLKHITFPNSIKDFGEHAFSESGLVTLIIPEGITDIGWVTFSNCPYLKSVTLPTSLKRIENQMFYQCDSLKEVHLSDSLLWIGAEVFSGCRSLESITIPNTVSGFGNNVFSHCPKLASIEVEEGNTRFDSRDSCNAIIETRKNLLWFGCRNTIIPHTVDSIRKFAFFGHTNLTSIRMPNRMKEIGHAAFAHCDSLKFIDLGGGMVKLGPGVFEENYNLRTVICRSIVPPTMGAMVFNHTNCSQTSLYVPIESLNAYTYADQWNQFNPIKPIEDTIPKHNYTIKLYAPDLCSDMEPVIVGDFNNWLQFVTMNDSLDEMRTVYTCTLNDIAGNVFGIVESISGWRNPLQYYDIDRDTWKDLATIILPETTHDTTLVFDFSDNSGYRFALCEAIENVLIYLVAPNGTPNAGIEILGSFNDWVGEKMSYDTITNLWMAQVQAKQSDNFRFHATGSLENEIMVYHDYIDSWFPFYSDFGSIWQDGSSGNAGYKVISLNLSAPDYYRWSQQDKTTAIGNQIVNGKCENGKYIKDGHIFILRGDKIYTIQGQEVK